MLEFGNRRIRQSFRRAHFSPEPRPIEGVPHEIGGNEPGILRLRPFMILGVIENAK